MKKLIPLITLFLVLGSSTYAQTKRIAHRSHSANLNNYAALEDMDNLGAIDIEDLYFDTAQRDSFIRAQDSVQLFYKKYRDSIKKLNKVKEAKFKKTIVKDSAKKNSAIKIQEKKKQTPHKKQSFPLPLLLLIAIPTILIALATKHLK